MAEASAYSHPEPVPVASQLSLLPFLSAIDGYLTERGPIEGLRTTLHRTMTRAGKAYLQQTTPYLPLADPLWKQKVGRTFPIDTGIIGAAYSNRKICRTRRYATEAELDLALREEQTSSHLPKSWLAIPFLGRQGQVVLVLFSECKVHNFFADDDRVYRIVAMTKGFCNLIDWLEEDPFDNIRNFPLPSGSPTSGGMPLFKVQEVVDALEPPSFRKLDSFNYEASAV
jgi:hypothetical protein